MSKSEITTKTATKVRDLDGFTGSAALFRLDPPMPITDYDYDSGDTVTTGTSEYVVASATVVMFSGPETYLFPADADGNITDWGELHGSYKGGLDHAAALHGAGYEVAS